MKVGKPTLPVTEAILSSLVRLIVSHLGGGYSTISIAAITITHFSSRSEDAATLQVKPFFHVIAIISVIRPIRSDHMETCLCQIFHLCDRCGDDRCDHQDRWWVVSIIIVAIAERLSAILVIAAIIWRSRLRMNWMLSEAIVRSGDFKARIKCLYFIVKVDNYNN